MDSMTETQEIVIRDKARQIFKLKDLETAFHFINSEITAWTDFAEHSGNDESLIQSQSYHSLGNCISSLKLARKLTLQALTPDDELFLEIDESFEDIEVRREKAIQHIRNLGENGWLCKQSPFTEKWIDCLKYNTQTGDAFFEFIVSNQCQHYNSPFHFTGYTIATHFQTPPDVATPNSAHLKNLNEQVNTLISERANISATIRKLSIESKDTISDAELKFATAQDLQVSVFNSFIDSSKSDIKNLELTYQEKLRLEAPALYWKNKADDFRRQGRLWALLLALTISIGISGFSYFFLEWLHQNPINLKLSTLEGAVIFAAILSSFVFATRTLSRLTFSAFHLQRDAEEREQLTHLYLSLSKETEVDAESRKIVLQSLFSRAETGLITNESGPTMPGVGEVVNAMSKGRTGG